MRKIYLLMLSGVLCSSVALAQKFVTESGAGSKDGSNWANAYDNTQLQQAINDADAETDPVKKQVWVAMGIYKPTEILSAAVWTSIDGNTASTTSDRDKTFILKTGVEIYGGFVGGEASINDRVLKLDGTMLNETILSGDLNNDNTANVGDAYHVVATRDDADGAVLDGFTIQHGYASNNDYTEISGGVRIRRSLGAIAVFSNKTVSFKNLVLKDNATNNAGAAVYSRALSGDTRFYFTNVRFENNIASGTGGAMYSLADVGASELNITNCVFLNNKGGGGTGGGALYFAGDSNDAILNITNSQFEGNEANYTATTYGGALRVNTGIANISNTTFKGNQLKAVGGGGGGAIYSTGSSTVNANGCTFENNTSDNVGGHWYQFNGVVNITNSNFTGGTATTDGGGYYLASAGTLNITSTTFENNSTQATKSGTGGAVYCNGNMTATSSTFKGNVSDANGGAIYQIGASQTFNVTVSTFENNTSTTTGGAIYFYSGTANVANCTFKGNVGTNGGALYVLTTTVGINKTNFSSNTANTGAGGAMYIYSGASNPSTTTISNSRFYSNTAATSGGAMFISANGGTTSTGTSTTAIYNSIFYNNHCKTTTAGNAGGGAIYQTRGTSGVSSTCTVVNSTFYANKSAQENAGYGFNNAADVKINLYNNIFYVNLPNYNETSQTSTSSSTSADIKRGSTAIRIIKNNLVQSAFANSATTSLTASNNIELGGNPLFASTNPTDYNFLYPASNSFAKDKGDKSLFPNADTEKDLLGNDRVYNGIIDLGAIEYSPVLPVKVSSFTAHLVNNHTQLKWSVGTEDNVNRYEVERSQNGVDFVKVAVIIANGSSSYQTTDSNPQVGDNYYRLVTVDNDGSRSQYGALAIVKVASLAVQNIQIYPNPVKGNEVKVSLGNVAVGAYSYKVVSAQGSVVQQGTLNYNGSLAVINLSAVANGVYVLHFSNGTQTKLVKQ